MIRRQDSAMAATKPRSRDPKRTEELLDEALEESFPASDPPALVGPGGGITGPNDPRQTRPDRRATGEPPNKVGPKGIPHRSHG
jgi:hypothetical protein